MAVEDSLRHFTQLIEQIHRDIEPLKQETMLLEDAIGYDNHELIDASDLVIREQDALQREYVKKIAAAADTDEIGPLLRQFEEEFINAVLDYRNCLTGILNRNFV